MQLKILPLTMMTATVVLAIKVGAVVNGGNALSQNLFISDVVAEEKTEAKKEEKAQAPEETKEKKEDASKKPSASAEDAKTEAATPPEENKNVSTQAPDTVKAKQEYSQIEVDLLQSLSKRREELEQWSKDLDVKDNLLTATEKRIDQKLAGMQDLKKQLDKQLALYNEKEDAKIKSLVKIYENMKPKDAARIFEQLDMAVLLEVVDKMGERKVAPVLAAMDAKKAMLVTTELAEQRRLNPLPDSDALTTVLDEATPAATTPAPR